MSSAVTGLPLENACLPFSFSVSVLLSADWVYVAICGCGFVTSEPSKVSAVSYSALSTIEPVSSNACAGSACFRSKVLSTTSVLVPALGLVPLLLLPPEQPVRARAPAAVIATAPTRDLRFMELLGCVPAFAGAGPSASPGPWMQGYNLAGPRLRPCCNARVV